MSLLFLHLVVWISLSPALLWMEITNHIKKHFGYKIEWFVLYYEILFHSVFRFANDIFPERRGNI